MKKMTVSDRKQFLEIGLEPFLRGELEGVIEFHAPVLNPLTDRRMLALVLGMSLAEVENLLYFRSLVVVDPGDTGLQRGEILEQPKGALLKREGSTCGFLGGAKGLEFLLNRIDTEAVFQKALNTEMVQMQLLRDDNEYEDRTGFTEEVEEEPEEEDEAFASYWERQRVLRTLQQARRTQDAAVYIRKNRESLFFQRIVLFPPEIRTLLLRAVQRIPKAVPDLEWQYACTIDRNRRLGRVKELEAPDVVLWYEQKSLQKEADKLIAGRRKENLLSGTEKNTKNWLWSLRDLILQDIQIV